MKKQYIFLICLLVLILWTIWGNTALEVNEWHIQSDRLPESFDGFRIAQVSDLHNTENDALMPLLEKAEPDVIVITGDLIDSGDTDVAVALDFVREAVKLAPCYYVSGNHESWVPEREELWAGLRELGVIMLDNASLELEREGESICMMGLADPDFGGNYGAMLEELTAGEQGYTVLLSHRPELFGVYAEFQIDLVSKMFSASALEKSSSVPSISKSRASYLIFYRLSENTVIPYIILSFTHFFNRKRKLFIYY